MQFTSHVSIWSKLPLCQGKPPCPVHVDISRRFTEFSISRACERYIKMR